MKEKNYLNGESGNFYRNYLSEEIQQQLDDIYEHLSDSPIPEPNTLYYYVDAEGNKRLILKEEYGLHASEFRHLKSILNDGALLPWSYRDSRGHLAFCTVANIAPFCIHMARVPFDMKVEDMNDFFRDYVITNNEKNIPAFFSMLEPYVSKEFKIEYQNFINQPIFLSYFHFMKIMTQFLTFGHNLSYGEELDRTLSHCSGGGSVIFIIKLKGQKTDVFNQNNEKLFEGFKEAYQNYYSASRGYCDQIDIDFAASNIGAMLGCVKLAQIEGVILPDFYFTHDDMMKVAGWSYGMEEYNCYVEQIKQEYPNLFIANQEGILLHIPEYTDSVEVAVSSKNYFKEPDYQLTKVLKR